MIGSLVISPPAWLVFDKNGYVVEQANQFAADGTPNNVTHNERDAGERLIQSFGESANAKAASRTAYYYGPHGVTLVENYQGGKLQMRTVNDYDERGNLVRSWTYGGSGALLSRTESVFDGDNRPVEWTLFGPDGAVVARSKEQFDKSGNLVERDELDGENRIVRSMVFQNDALFTWTQDPAFHGSEGLAVVDSEKVVPYSYEFREDGTLLTFVHHNSMGIGGAWNDDAAEALDARGNRIEKVSYQYERDSRGNWTRRTASAWDSSTGDMVPIQEDIREITYY